MNIEIIVTVDGVGYKGVFSQDMTQKEIITQIKFAFKQLGIFPEENANMKVKIVKPKEENLKVLDKVIIVE